VLDSYLDASQDEFVTPKPLNGDPDTGRLDGAPPPLWSHRGTGLDRPRFSTLADGPLKQGGTEMRTRFTDTQKAGIVTGLVLVLAVAAALVVNATGMDSNLIAWGAVWSITPTLATVIMLLLVTREGYPREGWKSFALHRFGLRVWWIAFVGTLLITLVATARRVGDPAGVGHHTARPSPQLGCELRHSDADSGDHLPSR
jgi:hypothetical protein